MITFERLRYFKAAAELEHINNAAKKLHVSPSSVSNAIAVLEQELQCQLFERRSRNIYLSEQGHLLLGKCEQILSLVNELPAHTNPEQRKLTGHYRIAANPFLMRSMLLPTISSLKKENPQMHTDLISADTGLAVNGVETGEYDCALVVRSISHGNLEESPIYQGKFEFVVRKNHPILKVKPGQRISMLNSLPALTFKPTLGPNFVSDHFVFKELGITPIKTDFFNDNQTAEYLLQNSNSWAFLPDKVLSKNKDSELTTVKLPKKWHAPYSIYLIKRKLYQEIFSPLERELLNFS